MSIHTSINLLKSRRTKIVATLGPASSDGETIRALIDEGVNIVRLNLSHGDHNSHRALVAEVQAAAAEKGQPIAILFDIPGPKIRIGGFTDGFIDLEDGAVVTVTTRDTPGQDGLISAPYPFITDIVEVGTRLMLDDGQVELNTEKIEEPNLLCRVIRGGRLTARRGLNIPGVTLPVPSLTARDRELAKFAIEQGADMLAQSFVRSGQDVLELRELVESSGKDALIIAKIEKREALEDIEAILAAADGIMVARGDLGVELAPEGVPVAQDQLIDRARAYNKPVIVATQMLDSMTKKVRPTRAEVSDVSQAVRSGVDAVMLSGESAVGDHPAVVVDMLDRIIRHTEAHLWETGAFQSFSRGKSCDGALQIWEAMGLATAQLSRDLRVRTILVVSHSGSTAAMVAAARPAAPVLAVSPRPQTCRRMNLLWGVIPVHVEIDQIDDPISLGRRVTTDLKLAEPGQTILVVRGYHEVPALNKPTITVVQL